MTVFDYAVVVVAAASLLLGFWRGLVSEVLALAAWIIGFLIARQAAPSLGGVFARWLADDGLRYVAGFATAFVLVLVAVAVLRLALRKLLKLAGLGLVDRFLGAVFGIARALAIVLGLVLLGSMSPLPMQPWWRDAVLAPPLETAVLALRPWLPQAVAKRVSFRRA